MVDGVYRYARRNRLADFMAMGWIDLGPCPRHHGDWSHLVRACLCNPDGKGPRHEN